MDGWFLGRKIMFALGRRAKLVRLVTRLPHTTHKCGDSETKSLFILIIEMNEIQSYFPCATNYDSYTILCDRTICDKYRTGTLRVSKSIFLFVENKYTKAKYLTFVPRKSYKFNKNIRCINSILRSCLLICCCLRLRLQTRQHSTKQFTSKNVLYLCLWNVNMKNGLQGWR